MHAVTEQGFSYRAWALCCVTPTRDFFERHVDRALREAGRHGINRLELHDYYIPWLPYGIAYRDYPKLSRLPTLFAGRKAPSDLPWQEAPAYMRALFQRIKAAGLKLNLWYHVGRDVPPELPQEYPEYADIDTGFVYDFERNCAREFLEAYPEVDALTVTSIAETDSILARPGHTPRRERLARLYGGLYEACRQAGRELVVRDFISTAQDYADFTAVVESLPRDVILMTKEVLGDWAFVDQERNAYLPRYAGRRLVVEFDSYGEFQGRTDVPYASPDYFARSVRELIPFGVEGAVGRIVHDYARASECETVFDSLNEVNVAAFSRAMVDPGPTLASLGDWAVEIYSDPGLRRWLPWAVERFGDAAPQVIALLRPCPALIGRCLTTCGFWTQQGSRLMPLSMVDRGGWYRGWHDPKYADGVLEDWLTREPRSAALIRAEKDDLVATTRFLLDRAASLPRSSREEGLRLLRRQMENLELLARASRAIGLLYAAGVLRQTGELDARPLRVEALQLAGELRVRRGPAFYHGLPETLRQWAEWAPFDSKPR